MKKILTVFLIPLIFFSVAACESSEEKMGSLEVYNDEDDEGNKFTITFDGVDEEEEHRVYKLEAFPAEGFEFYAWYNDDGATVSEYETFEEKVVFNGDPPQYYPAFNEIDDRERISVSVVIDDKTHEEKSYKGETFGESGISFSDYDNRLYLYSHWEDGKDNEINESTVLEDGMELKAIENNFEDVSVRFYYNSRSQGTRSFPKGQEIEVERFNEAVEHVNIPETHDFVGWETMDGEKIYDTVVLDDDVEFRMRLEEIKTENEKNKEEESKRTDDESENEDKYRVELVLNLEGKEKIYNIPNGKTIEEQEWYDDLHRDRPNNWYFEGWSTEGFGNTPNIEPDEFEDSGEERFYAIFSGHFSFRSSISPQGMETTRHKIHEGNSLSDHDLEVPSANGSPSTNFVGWATNDSYRASNFDENTPLDRSIITLDRVLIPERFASEEYELTLNFRDQNSDIIRTSPAREYYRLNVSGIEFPKLELEDNQVVRYWYYYRNNQKQRIDEHNSINNHPTGIVNLYPEVDYERVEVNMKIDGVDKTILFPKGLTFNESEFNYLNLEEHNNTVWTNSNGRVLYPNQSVESSKTLIPREARSNELVNVSFEDLDAENVSKEFVKGGTLATNFEKLPRMLVRSNFNYFSGWQKDGEYFDINKPIENDISLKPEISPIPEEKHIVSFFDKIFVEFEHNERFGDKSEEIPYFGEDTLSSKTNWELVSNVNDVTSSRIYRETTRVRDSVRLNPEFETQLHTVELFDRNDDLYKTIKVFEGQDYPMQGFLETLPLDGNQMHLGWFENSPNRNRNRTNQLRDIDGPTKLYAKFSNQEDNNHKNYFYNLETADSFDSFGLHGLIERQRRTSQFIESRGSSQYYGCGWIATYNVLKYMQNYGEYNEAINMADILRYLDNEHEVLSTGGKYPGGIVSYLNSVGVSANHYHTGIERRAKEADLSIILNVSFSFKSAHYRMMEFNERDQTFTVYNPGTHEGKTWDEIKEDYPTSYFTIITIDFD